MCTCHLELTPGCPFRSGTSLRESREQCSGDVRVKQGNVVELFNYSMFSIGVWYLCTSITWCVEVCPDRFNCDPSILCYLFVKCFLIAIQCLEATKPTNSITAGGVKPVMIHELSCWSCGFDYRRLSRYI